MSEKNENFDEENDDLNVDESSLNLNISEEDTEEVVNLNLNKDQKIDVLADGTEILRGESEEEKEEKEELSLKDLRKLVEFTTGQKDITDEELEALKENEEELERLIKISYIKANKLNYAPKKHFGVKYKKERKRKNRQAKKSRIINKK